VGEWVTKGGVRKVRTGEVRGREQIFSFRKRPMEKGELRNGEGHCGPGEEGQNSPGPSPREGTKSNQRQLTDTGQFKKGKHEREHRHNKRKKTFKDDTIGGGKKGLVPSKFLAQTKE